MEAHTDITTQLLQRCHALGFALAGVCEARPSDYDREYRAWIADGHHGEMDYLAMHVDVRLDPRLLLPGAKAIICVADRHGGMIAPKPGSAEAPTNLSPRGRIARYAQGDDYHIVIKRRLHALCDELRARFPDESFRACVDTAPIMEREHAQRAGLGAIGKNTLLIERGVGSHLLLGSIVTTLHLTPSVPAAPDPCGSCTRCIDACPTQAITPWSVDGSRCISYLTIEHRSEIDAAHHEAMQDWIFGCDICQDVCPHNQPKARQAATAVNEAYSPRNESFDLLQVLRWTEEDRRVALVRSSMKRAKLEMFRRNATIAHANASRRPRPAKNDPGVD